MIIPLLMLATQTVSLTIVFNNISRIKITLHMLLIIMSVSLLTGLFIGNYLILMFLLVFYVLGLFNGLKEKKALLFFYSSYSVTFYTVFSNLLSTIIENNIGIYSSIEFFAMLIPVIINFFIVKLFNGSFTFLRSHYAQLNLAFLTIINIVIISICTIQFGSYIWENNIGQLGNIRYAITLFFIFTILILVFYLNKKLNDFQKMQVENLKSQQIEQLSQYAKQVESLYFDIRTIRHDFVNIIKSLDHSISNNNIEEIRLIYDNVLQQVGRSLQSNRFDFVKLSNIKNDALKSLLATKVIEAQQKNIQINTEILFPLDNIYIDQLDYIRILSIFLDNAIEATENLIIKKDINVALIADTDDKKHTLIIENSYDPTEIIDIRKIYGKGISSKGSGRGLGLTIVKDLITKYPNTTLETEAKDGTFRQKIVFSEVN